MTHCTVFNVIASDSYTRWLDSKYSGHILHKIITSNFKWCKNLGNIAFCLGETAI